MHLGYLDRQKQWDRVASLIASAIGGSQSSSTQLELLLNEFYSIQGWHSLVSAIRRVVGGERGDSVLTDLNQVDQAIVYRILQVLEGGEDASRVPIPSFDIGKGEQPQQEQGVTLPQLLEYVERAAKGDKELGGQVFTAFQQMARDDNPLMSTMGKVLLRVLVGERNPNLDGLPDEVASAIRGMLGRLKNK